MIGKDVHLSREICTGLGKHLISVGAHEGTELFLREKRTAVVFFQADDTGLFLLYNIGAQSFPLRLHRLRRRKLSPPFFRGLIYRDLPLLTAGPGTLIRRTDKFFIIPGPKTLHPLLSYSNPIKISTGDSQA